MYLEPANPRLHRFALHLAIPGVPAGADGLPNNHQIPAPLAERLEAGLAGAAAYRRRRCRRRRVLRDLRPAGCSFRCKTAERLTDDAAALARPHSVRGAMMPLLFPPVSGRVGGGERIARSTLALAVQDKIQRVVRVDAAAIARAVGRDLGDGVAAAVAAALLFHVGSENEDGRALEHLAATRGHRVGGGGATLMSDAAAADGSVR